MANIIWNELSVRGKKFALQGFRIQAAKRDPSVHHTDNGCGVNTGEVLSFWNFKRPDVLDMDAYTAPSKGAAMKDPRNWYNWNAENWGTKWDALEVSRSERADAFGLRDVFVFRTAWAPPIPVFEAMLSQYPELQLQLKYVDEEGHGATLTGHGPIWIRTATH